MKIVVGSDPWGFELKTAIKAHLSTQGHEVIDIGGQTPNDEQPYWETAASAARAIQNNNAERGILFCGTGMGMAIVTNKFKGIVASVVESALTAKLCRAINNANILAMGGLIVTPFLATKAVDAFLTTAHTEGFEVHTEFLKKALREVAQIDESQT